MAAITSAAFEDRTAREAFVAAKGAFSCFCEGRPAAPAAPAEVEQPNRIDGDRPSWARPTARIDGRRSIVLVFDDQLSLDNPALKSANPMRDVAVLVDRAGGADEPADRRAFRARAVEAFAEELRRLRWRVDVVAVDRAEGPDALGAALRRRANRAEIGRFTAAEPGDAAMRFALERLAGRFRKPVGILDDRRFLCTRDEFAAMREAAGSPAGVYRILRRRAGLLMDGEGPEGGSWRIVEGGPRAEAKASRARDEGPAAPTVERAAGDLESFVETTLPGLGPCEDLDPASPHPFPCPEVEAALDAGLLNPLDVCRRIERAYREGRAPLAAAEHAIYRLVGLREYRRGLMRLGEIAG